MRSRRAVTWTAAVAAVASTVVVSTAPAQAAYESDYDSRTTVTFGENVHAQVPVTLDLPAPASGGAITSVTANWTEQVPQRTVESGNKTKVSVHLDVSACTADASCLVSAVLPTARMLNGTPTIQFVVSNSESTVGFVNRTLALQNPKPTVAFTAPQAYDALWGDVTLSADAAPAADAGAAALKGVRFYVDGNLGVDAPYLFDDTAPYAVTLPATDIAPVLGSQDIVAVAEDADGNLSQMPAANASAAVRRHVSVGPPPDASWTSPMTGGAIAGGMTNGVQLEFDAALPDSAPADPGQPDDPFIRGYDVSLDGTKLFSSTYDQANSWNNYKPGTKLRAIKGWAVLNKDNGLQPGRHAVSVRVITSYGSATVLTADILVADGVTWGKVTSGGRSVANGFWVTAGTLHRFTVPVATKVAGTRLAWVGAESGSDDPAAGGQDLFMQGWPCATSDPATCPASTVIHSDVWQASQTPGTAVLRFTAAASGDATKTLTRTLRIQPAARLSLDVSAHRVRKGGTVRLTGRLTRSDTGKPQPGRTVYVQWRRPDNLVWKRVAVRTTDSYGLVRFRTRATANGYYRLRSPEVRGTLGRGLSTEEKVYLRR